ncbi:IclR family transcriptional regulator [Streptomyces sp. SID8111]|uniref:IclR family transcriptional regulator n=1 Tax=Streptomyces sp. SID8111 TaxID=2706100 RepID=UPI0013C2699D|nr:IclR family transcriptional regulator [Streptomyces sp. SID8111]NEC29151.1 IclR family transcriptional regulator [Streptomyces sp. SID8111]
MVPTREQSRPEETHGRGADRAEHGPGGVTGGSTGGSAGSVQSVDRAVSVLEILARLGEAGVTEIAGDLGVHKSTASRLLGVLENRGLVTQSHDRGKYRLGAGVLRLAGAAAVRLDISQEGVPVCRELADELCETVNLAVLDDDAAVNIMQARGTAAVTAQNWLGRRTPLHATANGKVLLAHLPPTLRDGLLARPLQRFTEHTVTGAAALRGELETVVERGYACTLEELELGLSAVAAPVWSHEGRVVAAISVSGPVYRLTPQRLPALGERAAAAAADLSRRMGYGF